VIEHRAEIAHVKPSAEGYTFEKKLGFSQRRAAGLHADDLSARNRRRHASSLSCLALARFDRNLGFRAVTCPLDRAQDTSLRFIRDQSQQVSIFLVRLLKGESPISHSARVTHGISTPTQPREFKHETGNRSCQKVRPRIAPRPRNRDPDLLVDRGAGRGLRLRFGFGHGIL